MLLISPPAITEYQTLSAVGLAKGSDESAQRAATFDAMRMLLLQLRSDIKATTVETIDTDLKSRQVRIQTLVQSNFLFLPGVTVRAKRVVSGVTTVEVQLDRVKAAASATQSLETLLASWEQLLEDYKLAPGDIRLDILQRLSTTRSYADDLIELISIFGPLDSTQLSRVAQLKKVTRLCFPRWKLATDWSPIRSVLQGFSDESGEGLTLVCIDRHFQIKPDPLGGFVHSGWIRFKAMELNQVFDVSFTTLTSTQKLSSNDFCDAISHPLKLKLLELIRR